MGGPVAWNLLRATQFHPYVAGMLAAAARWRVVPTGPARLQPIAPTIVAGRLADAVHAGPGGRLPDIGGPEVLTLTELARTWAPTRPDGTTGSAVTFTTTRAYEGPCGSASPLIPRHHRPQLPTVRRNHMTSAEQAHTAAAPAV
jgi:hypothetical protein